MTEIRLNAEELKKLADKLAKSPDTVRKIKADIIREAAPLMKGALDAEIGGSGKVQSWQGQYLGSKGGYAAIRPKAKTFTETNGRGKRYAVGAVTNAIDSGHRFPMPSGRPGYRPRIKSERTAVPGRKFYKAAERTVEEIAEKAAAQVDARLHEYLEE